METKEKGRLIRRYLHWLKPYRGRLVEAGLFLTLSSFLALPLPLLTMYIIDHVLVAGRVSVLHMLCAVIASVVLFQIMASLAQGSIIEAFRLRVTADMQRDLYRHVLSLPFSFFQSRQTGYIMSRVREDVRASQGLFASVILKFFRDLVTLSLGLFFVFIIHWKMALVSSLLIPFFVLSIVLFHKRLRAMSLLLQEKSALVSTELQEGLAGIASIKSFATEDFQSDRMRDRIHEAQDQGFRTYLMSAVSSSLTGLTTALAPMVVLWYGGMEIMAGRLTLGQFVAFNSFLAYLYKPAEGLVNVNLTIQRSLGAATRIFEMLDTPGEETTTDSGSRAEGTIRFENLSFGYEPGRTVLDGIDLVIEPGEVVAIVGPSGAGKTTLINMIPRFYSPTSGRLLIDGIEAAKLPLRALRESIGVVAQDPFLFTGTVEENLRYGRMEATREEIVQAARRSCAHDFIEQMPRGYDTVIGERGTRLSGGQRQRLAMARTLLKDPPILIFDEATSSLDGETEETLLRELNGMLTGKTTLIVSHRLSFVSLADRVVFLKEGRVEEEGAHADLLNRSRNYRDLFGIKVLAVA